MTRILGAALLAIAMSNPGIAAQRSAPVTEVTVSGEVLTPGRAATTPPLTLRAAIAQVGGFTADAAVIEIYRRTTGAGPVTMATSPSEFRIEYVMRGDLASPEANPLLAGGEFIMVRRLLDIHAPMPRGRFGAGAFRLDWTTWGVTSPKVLTSKEPLYTRAGTVAKLQGTVELEVVVNADGTVGDARVLKGLDARLPEIVADLKRIGDAHADAVLQVIGDGPLGLDANAVECVKTWTFTPGTILGRATPIIQPVSVEFRLR